MTNRWRRALHRVIPVHLGNPLGLTLRLLKSREPAAYASMGYAGLSLLATPLDLALRPLERARYRRAGAGRLPLIFVCGAPRAGTTIVASTLLRHLPLAYFSNCTAVFPRSPLAATRWLRGALAARRIPRRSFYGRTAHLSGPNDALYLWARWLGAGQRVPREEERLDPESRAEMVRFFDAWEQQSGRPLLNKCNKLDAWAHLVAEALERSWFLCVERDPLYLAQSLYRARLEIHGDATHPYGMTDPGALGVRDPIESVCEQVRFHRALAERQEQRIGRERFWRLSYDDFCRDPAALVRRVALEILGLPDGGQPVVAPLEPSRRTMIDPRLFEALRDGLDERQAVPR